MDYFKEIKEMQNDFLKNPRENIKKLKKQRDEIEINQALMLGKTPEFLKLHKDIHEEYATLIHTLWSANVIHGSMFKDDTLGVMIVQRYNEWEDAVNDYKSKKEIDETIALRLSRAYASSLEIIWKKLKNIIFLAKMNPENKYLNINDLYDKFTKLEEIYKINLSRIKSVINSKLRNSIGHEDTYFIPPDIIVFLDKQKEKEIARITIQELYKVLIETTIITGAIVSVETTTVLSCVKAPK